MLCEIVKCCEHPLIRNTNICGWKTPVVVVIDFIKFFQEMSSINFLLRRGGSKSQASLYTVSNDIGWMLRGFSDSMKKLFFPSKDWIIKLHVNRDAAKCRFFPRLLPRFSIRELHYKERRRWRRKKMSFFPSSEMIANSPLPDNQKNASKKCLSEGSFYSLLFVNRKNPSFSFYDDREKSLKNRN